MNPYADKYDELWDAAYDLACQRANEEGDVDPDYDYELMEAWEEEYFISLCEDEGLDPYASDYVSR